jgi:hypothetical protein
MTPELERQLAADFPVLFSALARGISYRDDDSTAVDGRRASIAMYGISHGDGWYDILRRLAAKIEPWCLSTGAYAGQAKEKFGTLRFYLLEPMVSEKDIPLGISMYGRLLSVGPRASDDKVRAAVDEAEHESARTCEVCGAAGTLRDHNHWLSTRCDLCHDARERLVDRVESVERLLKNVIRPKNADEAAKWRALLYQCAEERP